MSISQTKHDHVQGKFKGGASGHWVNCGVSHDVNCKWMDHEALENIGISGYGFGFYYIATRDIQKDEEVLAEYVQSLTGDSKEPVLTLYGLQSAGHIPNCFSNTGELNQHYQYIASHKVSILLGVSFLIQLLAGNPGYAFTGASNVAVCPGLPRWEVVLVYRSIPI